MRSEVRLTRRRTAGRIVALFVTLGALSAVALGTIPRLTSDRGGRETIRIPAELERAVAAWNDGRIDEVLATTDRILEIRPLEPRALALRGFAQFQAALDVSDGERRDEMLVEATVALRRVLLADPDARLRAEVDYTLGRVYYHRGAYFFPAAIVHLTDAETHFGDRIDRLEYVALAQQGVGDVAGAEETMRDVLSRTNDPVHGLVLGEMLVETAQFREAADVLSRVVDSGVEGSVRRDALLAFGWAQHGLGTFGAARETLELLIAEAPGFADARFALGEVFLALDEPERARFEWREAVRLDPNHIESLQRLQEQ